MTEKVGAFGQREACDELAERFPECADGSQRVGAEQCFEFGEGLLDRIQVGTVGREPATLCELSLSMITISSGRSVGSSTFST